MSVSERLTATTAPDDLLRSEKRRQRMVLATSRHQQTRSNRAIARPSGWLRMRTHDIPHGFRVPLCHLQQHARRPLGRTPALLPVL